MASLAADVHLPSNAEYCALLQHVNKSEHKGECQLVNFMAETQLLVPRI